MMIYVIYVGSILACVVRCTAYVVCMSTAALSCLLFGLCAGAHYSEFLSFPDILQHISCFKVVSRVMFLTFLFQYRVLSTFTFKQSNLCKESINYHCVGLIEIFSFITLYKYQSCYTGPLEYKLTW